MDDLISRQQAIDAIYHHLPSVSRTRARTMLHEVPSAQPEKRTEKRMETHACDLIDRQAAIDALFELYEYQRDIDPTEAADLVRQGIFLAEKKIEKLPSAQPEQKWIPCSERLPEEYGNYLISIDGEEPDIGTINSNDPGGWSLCDANGFYWASDKALNITAWMPLPEPYLEDIE